MADMQEGTGEGMDAVTFAYSSLQMEDMHKHAKDSDIEYQSWTIDIVGILLLNMPHTLSLPIWYNRRHFRGLCF